MEQRAREPDARCAIAILGPVVLPPRPRERVEMSPTPPEPSW